MNRLIKSGIIIAMGVSSSYGLTLKQSVEEVLKSNPVVQERVKNFATEKQELTTTYSANKPKIDLRASAGYNKAGEFNNDVKDSSYSEYDTALVLTQNIFDGYKTSSKVNYQKSRILTAGYSYIQKANDTTFELVERYLNVLREKEIVKVLNHSVATNKEIARKVKGLYDTGMKVKSDVNKINSTYALSRSNLVVRKQNLSNSKVKLQRTYGKQIDVESLVKPENKLTIPNTVEESLEYAYTHNPTLLVSKYNIEGAQALLKESKSGDYPTLDLEISQYYNDQNKENVSFASPDDRFRVMLKLNYNLYNGGSQTSQIKKSSLNIKREIENQNNAKREVEESIRLSWLSYTSIQDQIKNLKVYANDAKLALNLYQQEYELNNRSLLDLLSIQNDVTSANTQLINAQYDALIAQYRLLNTMGKIVLEIQGEDTNYNEVVGLEIK